MIKTLKESKAHLRELVDRVSKGEEVIITVHGKPKARLCPISHAMEESREEWFAVLKEARAKYTLKKNEDSLNVLDEVRSDRF